MRQSLAHAAPDPDELLPQPKVQELLGKSHMTIHRWLKRNAFPPPIKINGKNHWRRRTINAWIDAQAGAANILD